MNPLIDLLKQYPALVVDGALATELERRGCDLRDPLWSAKALIETPDLIRQVHQDYFAAGADIAITASYQATIGGFMRRGLNQAESVDLLQRSVRLAREARDAFWAEPVHRIDRPRPLVAASVGPYGAFLANGSEYRGDYGLSEAQLMDFHRPRLAALLEADPDLLACETIPCLAEAQALVRLLTEFPNAWAWISFSAGDEAHICHGETFSECAAWLDGCPQVAAVGINCTAPGYLPALIRAARVVTEKPIVVYPNSGETWQADHHCWQRVSVGATFAAAAEVWYAEGATLIGGCCRTTPDHIRAIAAWVRRLPRRGHVSS